MAKSRNPSRWWKAVLVTSVIALPSLAAVPAPGSVRESIISLHLPFFVVAGRRAHLVVPPHRAGSRGSPGLQQGYISAGWRTRSGQQMTR